MNVLPWHCSKSTSVCFMHHFNYRRDIAVFRAEFRMPYGAVMHVVIKLGIFTRKKTPQSKCSNPEGEHGRLGIPISLCNGICEIPGLNLVHVASYPDRGFAWFSSVISFIVCLVFLKSFPAHHSLSSQPIVFNVCNETSSLNSLRSIKTELWCSVFRE